MKNALVAFVFAGAIAFAVTAANANPTRANVQTHTEVIKLAGGNAACITTDFGAVGGAGMYTTCAQSAAFTVPNALLGDACLASSTTFDGGLPAEARLSCDIISDTQAKVKLCYQAIDAGSLDVGSATYCARIIR